MESSTSGDNAVQPNGTTHSIAMNVSDTCSAMRENMQSTYLILLCFSVTVTVGLAFTVRRKNCWLSCGRGRPGLLQPVNFINEISRRWAYAACFVTLTNDVLMLLTGKTQLMKLPINDQEWMNTFNWLTVLVDISEAFAVCLKYYPLLACINQRRVIVANILGIVYLIPWIAIRSCCLYCFPIRSETIFGVYTEYIVLISTYIALYVVGLCYILDLVKNVNRRKNPRSELQEGLEAESSYWIEGNFDYPISHHIEHVTDLLSRKTSEQTDETTSGEPSNPLPFIKEIKENLRNLIRRLKYDNIKSFRYSTHLVCCTTTVATLVIWTMLRISASAEELFQGFSACLDGCINEPCLNKTILAICKSVGPYMYQARILFHIANAFAGFIVLFFVFKTLATYRGRWHQLLRGDHSWHMYEKKVDKHAGTLLRCGLKYAGYQVAYALFGHAVSLIVLWIVLELVSLLFNMPTTMFNIAIIMLNLFLVFYWKKTVLIVVITVFREVSQRLINRIFFLQDKGKVMALDNRRLYNAVSYCLFVLNVMVGFFSCLMRMLIFLALSILHLSRLDQPLLEKRFQTADAGYKSFVSMLLVDLCHNHPIVKVFVARMLRVKKQKELPTGVNNGSVGLPEEKRRRLKLIWNRYLKRLTLASNPSLVPKVDGNRLSEARNHMKQTQVGSGLVSIEIQSLLETTENEPPLLEG